MSFLSIGRWGIPQSAGGNAEASAEHEASSSKSADSRLWAFSNIGNTCYANSVLQALYFCEPFRLAVQEGRKPPIDSAAPATHLPDHVNAAPPVATVLADPHAGSKANGKLPVSDGKQAKNGAPPSRPTGPGGHRRTSSAASSAGQLTLGTPSGVPEGEPKQANGLAASNGGPSRGISPERQRPAAEETLLSTLRDLFCAISFHPKRAGVVAPHAFINQLRKQNELFRSTMHQDAHEFLGYLLNEIAEELERASPPPLTPKTTASATSYGSRDGPLVDAPKTWIHSLFEGVLTNETRCLTCETVTSRDESFLDLSIDIEDNSSVTSCLRQFSASEMLAQRNKFSCDTCCGLQEAEKRMVVKKMPRVLALHLKRFKYQEDLQRFTKLAYRVAFPSELRLFNTIPTAQPDPDLLYSLWAVVVHIGVGPHAGHYITILRSQGKWLCFDDENVTEVHQNDLLKYFGDTPGAGSGYVLFYEAIEVDRPGRTLVHLAHDMTPAQAAQAERNSPQAAYRSDEVEPGSPTGSYAAGTHSDGASLPSPNLLVSHNHAGDPPPLPASNQKDAGLKGFFGLGRRGGQAGDDSPDVPTSPASRKASLPMSEIIREGSLPPDTSDTASTTSSVPAQSPAQPTNNPSTATKGLFGRGFLSKTKSLRRPVSGSGLLLDTDVPAAASAASAPPLAARDEGVTSPKKQKRGLFGSKN